MSHRDFLRMAVRLAYENVVSGRGGPFGAVVIKDDQVVSTGVNRVTDTNDPTAHAEVEAIRQACHVLHDYQLRECVLYASCEPCPMCLGAIYWARPKAVYYVHTREQAAAAGFDDSFIYEQVALPPDERAVPTIHMDQPDEPDPFEAWLRAEARVTY